MNDVVRTTAPDADPYAWALDDPEPPVRDDYTPEYGDLALEVLGETLVKMQALVSETDTTVTDAARFMSERLDVEGLVGTVDMVADLRRRLAITQAYLERAAGLATAEYEAERRGTLPDGRTYEVTRSKTRKAWDHDGWKHDVRRVAIERAQIDGVDVVNADTGETVDVHSLLTAVQEAHGSGPPRVGVLKEFGLSPDDYCETWPGPFTVRFSAPAVDDAT